MKLNLENKSAQWIVLLLLAFTWGSSFILMKRGLEVLDEFQVAALRISFAGLVMLPFAFSSLKKIKPKNIIPIAVVGYFGNFLPAFLFTKAQTVLSSSLTGMLNSLVPFFTLLLGLLFFNAQINKKAGIGVAIGLMGAIGLILSKQSNEIAHGLDEQWWYAIFPIMATFCYATSVNIIKYYLADVSSLAITAVSFLFTFPVALTIFFLSPWELDFQQHETDFLVGVGYIAILGVVGTALAVIIFNALIKNTTAVFASSVTYIIPIVAILWGLFDGEEVTQWQLAFMGTILAGVYLVKSK